jgi:fluoroquinolone transport system permease protein
MRVMRPLFRCFGMFLRQVSKDSMLYAVLAAPLLAGSAFCFGLPAAESALCRYFGEASILSGYYLLFDLFLSVMTPYIICFVSSMVILAEYDENMAAYMAVTPVGKRGYIISRLVFPAVTSIFASAIVMSFFSLTTWALPDLLITCTLSSLLSIAVSLLIVAFSHNRVEGMALAKLSGIILLGLPVPFFLFSSVQYLFSLLPSFWIAKLCIDGNYLLAIPPALFTSFLWIWALYGRFAKKLS